MSSPIQLLQDTAARLFADAVEPEVTSSLDSVQLPEYLWRAIDDNGLASLALSEDAGGIGLGAAEALPLLRMAGAFALSIPLAETLLARPLLEKAGLPVPEGPVQLWNGAGPTSLEVENGDAGPQVTGNTTLPWAGRVPIVLVAAGKREGLVALLTDYRAEPAGAALSGEPRATLDLRSHTLAEGTWSAVPANAAEHTLRQAATGRSQMIAGAMERVLDLTIEYARTRIQFGRPIGRFQAVQQMTACLAGEVAAVGVAADAACRALAQEDLPDEATLLAVASAKSQASQSVATVARIAHQVHGAIGYTREHDLQRFTRALWSWRDQDGDETYWQARAGKLALEAGATGLWDLLAGS